MRFFFVACNKNKKLYRNDASFIYRCENLAYHLELLGHKCEFVHLRDFSLFRKCDVVVFHRPVYSLRLHFISLLLKFRGIVSVVDADDLIFDSNYAKHSPAYRNSILSLEIVKKRFKNTYKAFTLFENFTLSTQPLAEHIHSLFSHAKAIILPNTVHFSWLSKNLTDYKVKKNKIISYLPGTKSHDKDFSIIQSSLERFLLKHSDVKIHITGPLDFVLNVPKDQILYKEKVPFELHYKNYENIWLNIAPLEQNPFNESKSALKIIEAGFFKIPTICSFNSDNLRFRDAGAIIANSEKDWFDVLEKFYEDNEYFNVKKNLEQNYAKVVSIQKELQEFIRFVKKKRLGILKNNFFCIYGYEAKLKRKHGEYSLFTLHFYYKAWKKSQKPKDYLAYLLFRRDLGYMLTQRKAQKLQEISTELSAKKLLIANKLLFEFAHIEAKKVHSKFVKYLQENQKKGICVVGNSPDIDTAKLGNIIDSKAIVIRFNRCFSTPKRIDTRGKKIDVWVKAPDYKGKIDEEITWSVITGPERFYGVKQDFINEITDIPLSVWKELVNILHAPPSAGITILYWIKNSLKNFEGVSIAGFNGNANKIYHHADPMHQASVRHNWVGERILLESFKAEGLECLD